MMLFWCILQLAITCKVSFGVGAFKRCLKSTGGGWKMGRTTLSQIKSQGILVFLLLVPALFGTLFFPSHFALTSSHWLGFHIKTT